MPALYLALLFRARRSILGRTPCPLSRAISFLWADYEPRFWWWEPLEMARKLTLTSFVLVRTERYPQLRLLVAILTTIAALMCQLVLSPYRQREDDWIALGNHLALLLVFLACHVINTCEVSAAACRSYGMGETALGPSLVFMLAGTLLTVVGCGCVPAWSQWPSWRGNARRPRAPQTAAEGVRLPSAPVRRGPPPPVPPRGRRLFSKRPPKMPI